MALLYDLITIRSYDSQIDKSRVEELDQICGVGPADKASLFTDTLGDPICRIRNSPLYNMLVAELNTELIGVIQGSVKMVAICRSIKNRAIVGYILGLRVSPNHRKRGVASRLVRSLEDWFIANHVDFAYMATERDNEASLNLFKHKHGFTHFRTPAILVNPVSNHTLRVSTDIEILKLSVDQAEKLYKRMMNSTEFFPQDIDAILKNKLSLGTWVAYPRGESWESDGCDRPRSWAVVSVWNSGKLFKLRVAEAPASCLMCLMGLRYLDRVLPCLKIQAVPELSESFGFYFMYGVRGEGLGSGLLLKALCRFVHNMSRNDEECKLVVTEVGESDALRAYVPHSRLLSCTEDFWCIKALKNEVKHLVFELSIFPPPVSLFVDPREV